MVNSISDEARTGAILSHLITVTTAEQAESFVNKMSSAGISLATILALLSAISSGDWASILTILESLIPSLGKK